jgi:hypothetical protein
MFVSYVGPAGGVCGNCVDSSVFFACEGSGIYFASTVNYQICVLISRVPIPPLTTHRRIIFFTVSFSILRHTRKNLLI